MTRGRLLTSACAMTLALAGIISGSSAAAAGGYLTFIRGSATSQPSVWIAAQDGSSARRLGAGDQATLSPDGAYVAVQRALSSSAALALYRPNRELASLFFSAKRYAATPLAWSADSRYLAVQLLATNPTGSGELELIDTKTMKAHLVAKGLVNGASFDPAGGKIAYGLTSSQSPGAPVNIYSAPLVGGGAPAQVTTDGRSLNPLWLRSGLLFDHETLRGAESAPADQLWLKSGTKLRQLTHLRLPQLIGGLVPMAASSDGNRILAAYQGEDTDIAWTVQLSPLRVSELKVNGKAVQGDAAISSTGRQLLVTVGGFEQPADDGTVEEVGFNGGTPTKLTRGAAPSWNR
jgi:hypothetical protein